MKKTALLCSLLILCSCAGNTVQELETSLMTAEASAIVYVDLQPCSSTSPIACSKYSIVKTINDSRSAAKIAVIAARDAQSSADANNMFSVAETATDAFTAIINSSVVQKAIKGE